MTSPGKEKLSALFDHPVRYLDEWINDGLARTSLRTASLVLVSLSISAACGAGLILYFSGGSMNGVGAISSPTLLEHTTRSLGDKTPWKPSTTCAAIKPSWIASSCLASSAWKKSISKNLSPLIMNDTTIDTTIDTSDPAEFERKKKFFTFLPLFILPILILLFWALGGGKGNAADLGDDGGATTGSVSQVKTDLPGAIVEREESKRGVYEREAKDRERRRYDMARDPYADQLRETESPGAIASGIDDWEQRFNARTGNLQRELDPLMKRWPVGQLPPRAARCFVRPAAFA